MFWEGVLSVFILRILVNKIMPDNIITETIVFKKLNNLNVYKSAGHDEMLPKIVRECFGSLAKFLCSFYNKSMFEKSLPDE